MKNKIKSIVTTIFSQCDYKTVKNDIFRRYKTSQIDTVLVFSAVKRN